DDWYLPAIDQLDEIESESSGLTDFNFFTQYWSSTEVNSNDANYYEQGVIRSGSKFSSFRSLCIRDLN
ncbi:MAG: DUF1566 domain-containing protein, partial [Nanoarchaeota archaeon]|nr:DUF1566 domain-containing protein [Nanoarchaeota archaeon]